MNHHWILDLKEQPSERVDLSILSPTLTSRLSLEEIEQTGLPIGTDHVWCKDLFSISEANTPRQTVQAPSISQRSERVSERVEAQRFQPPVDRLTLRGDLSMFDHVGSQMTGGLLRVDGSIGHFCGSQMRNGLIIVTGNCGYGLGARNSQTRTGMRGGEIVVCGSVANGVAERMRRGTIFISGDCQDRLAVEMIAGTVVVQGSVGVNCMMNASRGSVVLDSERYVSRGCMPETMSKLTDPVAYDLNYLGILQNRLTQIFDLCSLPCKVAWDRRSVVSRGDLVVGGKAELIFANPLTL